MSRRVDEGGEWERGKAFREAGREIASREDIAQGIGGLEIESSVLPAIAVGGKPTRAVRRGAMTSRVWLSWGGVREDGISERAGDLNGG